MATPLTNAVHLQLMKRANRGDDATLVVSEGYYRVFDRVQWMRADSGTNFLVHSVRKHGCREIRSFRLEKMPFYMAIGEGMMPGTTWPLDWPAMARALAFTHDTDPRAVLVLLERWLIPPVALMCLEYVTGQWPTLDMQLEAAEPPPPPPPCPNDDEDIPSTRKKPRIARS